jgi:DNA polymerase-3 subunit gamma/tau
MLAVKYRPQTFADVCGQNVTIQILKNEMCNPQQVYLFIGNSGVGKTTIARIFAKMITNDTPLEIDAASNNSVDDIKAVMEFATTQPLFGDFRVIILDEVQILSKAAWDSMLKFLEEPPPRTIIMLCTTEPHKVPTTIFSRAESFKLSPVSKDEIFQRLIYILQQENITRYEEIAIDYIARLAEGSLRTAISMLEKCIHYSRTLSFENVMAVLGYIELEQLFTLTGYVFSNDKKGIIDTVEQIYNQGKDLNQFIKQYRMFVLDCLQYYILGRGQANEFNQNDLYRLLEILLTVELKEVNPKNTILAVLLLYDRTK